MGAVSLEIGGKRPHAGRLWGRKKRVGAELGCVGPGEGREGEGKTLRQNQTRIISRRSPGPTVLFMIQDNTVTSTVH